MTTVTGSADAATRDEQFDPSGGRDLFEAIDSMRSELEAGTERAERERTLPSDIAEKFRELGLFWLKTPEELGGRPLHPLAFANLIEHIAYFDASAAWAAMIGCGSTGGAARWLTEAGVARVFPSRSQMPIFAGQPHPRGIARRTEEGYVVSGRWSFASGIHHSDWVLAGARVEGTEPGAAGSEFGFVLPKSDVTVHDNWHVAGLEGTGSSDYSLEEVFVPFDLTYERTTAAVQRGGPLFRQDGIAFVGNEVPPFAVGVANRAIDDMLAMAKGFSRARGNPLGERGVFHKELGLARTRVDAARLYYRDAVGAAFDAACSGVPASNAVQQAMLSSQTYVSETCADVVSNLFRFGGGRVLLRSDPMQRHLRNLIATRQHIAASDENYEIAGRAMLEEWGARAP